MSLGPGLAHLHERLGQDDHLHVGVARQAEGLVPSFRIADDRRGSDRSAIGFELGILPAVADGDRSPGYRLARSLHADQAAEADGLFQGDLHTGGLVGADLEAVGRDRPDGNGLIDPGPDRQLAGRYAGDDESAIGPRGGDVVSLGLERHPVGVGGLGRRHVDLETSNPFGSIGDDASLDAAHRAQADLPPGGLRLPVDQVQLLRTEGGECDLYCTETGPGHAPGARRDRTRR